jgi:ligand-binding sensor protein
MDLTEMTRRQLIDEFSDAYKVAHCVRPRGSVFEEFCNLTEVEMRIKLHELHSLICSMPDKNDGE